MGNSRWMCLRVGKGFRSIAATMCEEKNTKYRHLTSKITVGTLLLLWRPNSFWVRIADILVRIQDSMIWTPLTTANGLRPTHNIFTTLVSVQNSVASISVTSVRLVWLILGILAWRPSDAHHPSSVDFEPGIPLECLNILHFWHLEKNQIKKYLKFMKCEHIFGATEPKKVVPLQTDRN